MCVLLLMQVSLNCSVRAAVQSTALRAGEVELGEREEEGAEEGKCEE